MAGRCLCARVVSLRPLPMCCAAEQAFLEHSRLDGLGESVQPVLNLACLLPNGVQRARVARGIGPLRATEWRLVAQVVSRGS